MDEIMTTSANTVTDSLLGTMPTKVLHHGASGARVEIAICGATVLNWQAPFKGELGDFIAGFVSEEDFWSQKGMRNSLMFPFANRLRNDQYTWDGATYEVPKQYRNDPEVIHGFVRVDDWVVGAAETADATFVAQTFTYQIRGANQAWYPFDLDITVRYELTATDLNVSFTYRNVGTDSAPAGVGWHPYFMVPGHVTFDDLKLEIPGRTKVLMDDKFVPLAGDAAYERGDANVVHSALAGVDYDDAWLDLVADPDGIVRTRLTEPATGAGMAMWQDRGSVLIYTGGAFPVLRGSIAIEPVESTTDAFNRPDREQDVRLDAGAERTFRFGASVLSGN